MKALRQTIEKYADVTGNQFDGLPLSDLGLIHMALVHALDEVREALTPAIHQGHDEDFTYLELATMSGYGSTTTISKIMKLHPGGPPGRGPKPFHQTVRLSRD